MTGTAGDDGLRGDRLAYAAGGSLILDGVGLALRPGTVTGGMAGMGEVCRSRSIHAQPGLVQRVGNIRVGLDFRVATGI